MATLTEKDIAKIRRRLKWSAVLLNDEDPLSNVLNTVRADVEKLLAHITEQSAALEPFSMFIAFVTAGLELDGDAPLKDDHIIATFMGNGASAQITVGDLRRAALTKAGTKP